MMEKHPSAVKTPDIPFWHTRADETAVLPAFIGPDNVAEIQSRDMYDSDIIISSFPKAGSTWMKAMLTSLLGQDIPMFCAAPPSYISSHPHPRVFKEHLPLRFLPDSVKHNNSKIIYLIRCPKDTVVSLNYHMTLFKMDDYHGSLHDTVRLFTEGKTQFGDWAQHFEEWCAAGGIPPSRLFIIRYEDMLVNCHSIMEKVMTFIGRSDIPVGKIHQVVNELQFNKMRQKDLAFVPGSPSFRARDGLRDTTRHFLREGRSGQWRRSLTVYDNDMIDDYLAKLPEKTREKLCELGVI